MDLLEHPLEAVAFRLYSLPEVSASTGAAAWTCVAAVLAAVAAGIWRLRSSAPATAAAKPLCPELEPTTAEDLPPAELFGGSAAASSTAPPEPPKERYTAYYCDAGCVGFCDVGGDDDDDNGEDDDEEEREDVHGGGARRRGHETTGPLAWEEVVRTLRPLSPAAAEGMLGRGSVVQLWEWDRRIRSRQAAG